MTTKTENFMRMVRAVGDLLVNHESTWNGLPRFSAYGARFYELLKETNTLQVHADILSTGVTADKHQAAEAALHLGSNLSRRAIAFAEEHQLHAYRNQLKINRHELLHGHDAETLYKLRDVEEQLLSKLPSLSDYGLRRNCLRSINRL